jgi:toluene monooxygenase system ferredoxin subunit
MGFKQILSFTELWNGELKHLEIDGQDVLLVKIEDKLYAYKDHCGHQGVPLSQGVLSGKILTCCAHHWQYDVCTGCGVNPSSTKLISFPIQLIDGEIFIEVAGDKHDPGE